MKTIRHSLLASLAVVAAQWATAAAASTDIDPAEAWQAVAAAESDIAAADFGSGKRPPVKLTDAMWASLPVSGDEGARALMRERPEMVEVVACEGSDADVDTLEDLRRWS